jgi:hypothetical protein
MAYFAIGMALHSEGSYEDVLGLLTDGLAWTEPGVEPVKLPSKSAIFQARARLGSEPLRALFERVATPLAEPGASGCWLAAAWSIDGTRSTSLTPTPAQFDRRRGVNRVSRLRSSGPAGAVAGAEPRRVRCCGRSYGTGENTLAGEVIGRLEPGMVLLADRGVCGYPLWSKAAATGADLLWRAMSNMKPRPIETLADGSWLAELRPSGNAGRNADPLTIRVVDYEIDDGRTNGNAYRLFTTILDPDEASAEDLASLLAARF